MRDVTGDGPEFQVQERFDHLVAVVVPELGVLEVEFDRHVSHDGCKYLAVERRLPVFFQQVAHPLGPTQPFDVRYLVKLLVDLLEPPQVRQDRACRLLANARHAGDVVRGIAFERLHVRHVFRSEALIPFLDGLHVVDAGVSESGVHEEPDVRRNQLELVGVSRDDEGFDALVLGPRGERADEVVRLESVVFKHRYLERFHDRLDHRDLFVEFRVDWRPVRFVLREQFVPKSGSARVQRERHVGRGVVPDDLEERVEEPVCAAGVPAGGGAQPLGNGEPRPEDHGVAVHDEEERLSFIWLGH